MADTSSARTSGFLLREKIVEENEKEAEEKSFVGRAANLGKSLASDEPHKPPAKLSTSVQKKVCSKSGTIGI
jgi:hypothetical protein